MNSASLETDVAIVGAGPSGLTLACALAQLNVRVRVIDKSSGTKTQPRAAIIWQRAQEYWSAARRDAALSRTGPMPSPESTSTRATSFSGGIDLGQTVGEYPHPLILEQHITERLLVERLRELGVAVDWNTELVDLTLGDHCAILETERERPGAAESKRLGWSAAKARAA